MNHDNQNMTMELSEASFVDDNTLTVNVNRLRKKLEAAGPCPCYCVNQYLEVLLQNID